MTEQFSTLTIDINPCARYLGIVVHAQLCTSTATNSKYNTADYQFDPQMFYS